MARRRSSFADDVVELTSRVPWWVGVLLAVVCYLVLHAVAAQPLKVNPKAPSFVPMIIKGLATAGQYLLPILFLFGAGLSAFKRRRAANLAATVRHRNDARALNDMSWREFETLVGEAFRQRGYAVTETGGGGADGGVDLELLRNRETYLVQCKQWRANKVGVEVVRELYGLMAARGAAGGFVVTSGTFSDESRRFAEGRNIELLDGAGLNRMIAAGRPRGAEAAAGFGPGAATAERATVVEPVCPRCGSGMAKRLAMNGANAGSYFWGCRRFPACKGTLPVA